MKDLVEDIIKSLVDNPGLVEISETVSNGETKIRIQVPQSDIGQVIGRQGRIANSIRTLAKACGTKKNQRVFVEITDDEAN